VFTYHANGNQTNQQLPWQKTTMSYHKESRMATFAEDATFNTYASDGFKKVENGGRVALDHHLGWNGLSAGSGSKHHQDVPHRGVSDAQLDRKHVAV
jgi:hypothetical protein